MNFSLDTVPLTKKFKTSSVFFYNDFHMKPSCPIHTAGRTHTHGRYVVPIDKASVSDIYCMYRGWGGGRGGRRGGRGGAYKCHIWGGVGHTVIYFRKLT